MEKLTSSLEGQEGTFEELSSFFQSNDYDLGGGWQNDHGYFDRMLDPREHTTGMNYLRIPVIAVEGNIGEANATVRLGTPFVLCHQYQDSLDDGVEPHIVGSFFDQFSEPENKDAPIKEEWLQKAKTILQETEKNFASRKHN